MAGGPTTEQGVSRPPALPIFKSTDMPSAKQNGMLIAVDDGDGKLELGVSLNGVWYLFNSTATVP